MDITIYPKKLTGSVTAIPSKSQAHRLLICAAFADKRTTLSCLETNEDIEATAGCLCALGANIQRTDDGYAIEPVKHPPAEAVLDCGESGSTLRFMLPVVGALGVRATFIMHGRLPSRPLSPLWEEMNRMGCTLCHPTQDTISCSGRLSSGTYTIDGSVSSQFITGLLFAFALMDGRSKVQITGSLESVPYISMTQAALKLFGVSTNQFEVNGGQPLISPGHITVEGDWSNGAFFLAANALGNCVSVSNLDEHSLQGDRAAAELLTKLQEKCVISAADIPDLIPILSVVACANAGGVFTNIRRLRLKESDRVETVAQMLRTFGCKVDIQDNQLTVYPGNFHGGIVDSAGDHRIAMSAAIAATAADSPVTILDAHCVAKSYPTFWDTYKRLGGCYEQHIR